MERILIVGPAWIGDMVMAQSAVARLKALHPGASIDLIAPPWTAPLGARMPGIDRVHLLPSRRGFLDFALRRRLGVELRPEGYGLAVILPNSFKSALVPFFAGVPVRRGFRGEMRYWLLNDLRVLDKRRLPRTVDQFVALAESRADATPVVAAPELATESDKGTAIAGRLGLDLTRPAIALAPGAEYGPAKQWPAAHFARLASNLSAKGYQSWVFGSPKDKAIGETIRSLAPDAPIVNLAGRTELIEAIDLLGLAKGMATNDSGLMHVAGAIGLPLVAMFGSTTPAMTPPLGRTVAVVERELPCRPCFKRECPLGHLDCLNGLAPDDVAARLETVLAEAGRSRA